MEYYIVKTELYHHGVKGMKWGIRKDRKKSGSPAPSGKKKSIHRLMLEEKYKAQGLSQKDAEKQAAARIKTEKILAVSAGVAVGACAAYVANKKLKDRIDGVIKAGEGLQRVEMKDTGGKLHDVFYTSKGKYDNKRYEALLGFNRLNRTGEAYLMRMEANSDIKIASKDNAAKIFGELYKNDEGFRASAREHVSKHFTGVNKLNPDDLSKKNMKKLYENFNANLIEIKDGTSGVDKVFYDKLKKSGYGAVQDINDMKFSGYKAKSPLIVFGNKNNVVTKSVEKMSMKDIIPKAQKEYKKMEIEQVVDKTLKKYGLMTAGTLTVAATSTYVSDYRTPPTEPQVNL